MNRNNKLIEEAKDHADVIVVEEPVSVEEPIPEVDKEETLPKKEIPILQKEDDTFETLTVAEGAPELCKYVYWARDSCASCQGPHIHHRNEGQTRSGQMRLGKWCRVDYRPCTRLQPPDR